MINKYEKYNFLVFFIKMMIMYDKKNTMIQTIKNTFYKIFKKYHNAYHDIYV
jgi:hypothetical protein